MTSSSLTPTKVPFTARRLVLAMLICHIGVVRACADGLVFKLPEEGVVAEFREVATISSSEVVLPEAVEATLQDNHLLFIPPAGSKGYEGKVTIASVGKERRALQDCRWIELVRETRQDQGNVSRHVLKILVPEEYLTRGAHSLDHALLAFYNPKERDQGMRSSPAGFNRISYELDRFLPVFPPPLTAERRLKPKAIETKAGVFRNCEIIVGTTEFDRPLLGGGRWAFQTEWQIALHNDAPFGVVEVRSKSNGREIDEEGGYIELETSSVITLSGVGKDAKGTPIEELRGH